MIYISAIVLSLTVLFAFQGTQPGLLAFYALSLSVLAAFLRFVIGPCAVLAIRSIELGISGFSTETSEELLGKDEEQR